ncbi:MAG TPA: hypothetical protein PK289_01570 [Bacteroidia bacterium]|nr:hypothetical protein [Bacteroidia bacterium]
MTVSAASFFSNIEDCNCKAVNRITQTEFGYIRTYKNYDNGLSAQIEVEDDEIDIASCYIYCMDLGLSHLAKSQYSSELRITPNLDSEN